MKGVRLLLALALTTALALGARDARAQGDPGADARASSTAAAHGSAEEGDPAALFRAATDALAGDRSAEAIVNLEALGDRGVVDAVVSYNRGLAYAARVRAAAEQPGDLGRAAHGFEEARELSEDRTLVADANLALAAVRAEVARRRARAGDPIEMDDGVSLGRSIVNLLPENVWAVLAALCAFALTVGIVLRARAEQRRLKVAGTTTCAIAGGLLLLSATIVHHARDMRLELREAVVIAPSTRLLDDNHLALPAAAPLPEGARVQLLDESGGFAHVMAGRAEGWLPSSTILPMAR